MSEFRSRICRACGMGDNCGEEWIDPKTALALDESVTSDACHGHDEIRRLVPSPGYETLASIMDDALAQAQSGKGIERHAGNGEAFVDQQIVQLGEWMGGSTAFAVGQACKKSIESTRLPDDRARIELLGAINYLAAAIIVIDRRAVPR